MKLSEQQLVHDLEVLRHGGAEAIGLFMEMARKCFEKGGTDYLSNWVNVATPALPEADRHSTMTLLLRVLYGDYNQAGEISMHVDEQHTLQ